MLKRRVGVSLELSDDVLRSGACERGGSGWSCGSTEEENGSEYKKSSHHIHSRLKSGAHTRTATRAGNDEQRAKELDAEDGVEQVGRRTGAIHGRRVDVGLWNLQQGRRIERHP